MRFSVSGEEIQGLMQGLLDIRPTLQIVARAWTRLVRLQRSGQGMMHHLRNMML